MYIVNIVNIIKEQLSQETRTQFNVRLHEWWLHFVRELHLKAHADGNSDYEWATTTTQIGSLMQLLNAHFDPDGEQIYITDAEWIEEIWVFLDGEPYDDVTLWLDSEDITVIAGAEEVYLFSDADMNLYQFIVWIPAFLDTEEMLEQIAAMVNDHKLAGKNYIIKIIE